MPESVLRASTLRALDLSCINLGMSAVEPNLSALLALTRLELSDCALVQLPVGIIDMRHLAHLDVSRIRLMSIPLLQLAGDAQVTCG